jgi:RNA polymerase sigma factor (sigma-70 family)
LNQNKNSTNDNQLNEHDLINGCIRNDVHCQKLLYEKYSPKMMGVSLRYCNSKMEAEDVLQDAFIKIFDKIKTFKGEGSFEGWIRKVVVFTALKSNDKRVNKFEPGDIDNVQEPSLDSKAVSNMETAYLMNILQELPVGYRTVFNLYAVEGYSHKEIGKMLGVTDITSRTQYSRAKQYLLKILAKHGIKRI